MQAGRQAGAGIDREPATTNSMSFYYRQRVSSLSWIQMSSLVASVLVVATLMTAYYRHNVYDDPMLPSLSGHSSSQEVKERSSGTNTTIDNKKHHNNKKKSDDDVDDDNPQVVLLLSFPNSGTSYTIMNVEKTANVLTASNYARDFHPLIPVVRTNNGSDNSGPFLHYSSMNNNDKDNKRRKRKIIPHHVLTKTHCAGYCTDCGPQQYLLDSLDDFERGCYRIEPPPSSDDDKGDGAGGVVSDHYNASNVVAAIHIFRNPLDNIVSRMHLEIKKKKGIWPEYALKQLDNTKRGVEKWCEYLDTIYGKEEHQFLQDLPPMTDNNNANDDDGILQLVPKHLLAVADGQLPCHADFFRYVQWHNYAMAMTSRQNWPVYYLFYENYTTAYDDTVQDILDFLQYDDVAYKWRQQRAGDNKNKKPQHLPFVPGKTYADLFDNVTINKVARYIHAVATPAVWSMVRHYFE